MRQADINRLSRALEHLVAAKTHLGNISPHRIGHVEHVDINAVTQELGYQKQKLENIIQRAQKQQTTNDDNED